MKICVLASPKRADTAELLERLQALTGAVPVEEADVIVTLGGDGFLLRCLHDHVHLGKPFFGINRGTRGFLLNPPEVADTLLESLEKAAPVEVHPLRMIARGADGSIVDKIAFNEVSLTRTGVQAAKIRISVDGRVRMDHLVGDGVLVSTPMGSTAYNLSAYGPILPLNANLLALTPVCPFRPRRWSGALLEDGARVTLDVIDPDRRGVHAIADFHAVENVASLDIYLDRAVTASLLFAPGCSLDERIRDEQFEI